MRDNFWSARGPALIATKEAGVGTGPAKWKRRACGSLKFMQKEPVCAIAFLSEGSDVRDLPDPFERAPDTGWASLHYGTGGGTFGGDYRTRHIQESGAN